MSTSKRKLDRISERYHDQFLHPQSPAATEMAGKGRKYLRDHGINNPDIVKKYRLGVVIDPMPGDERFQGMLSVPYLSRRGGVNLVKYRALDPDVKPKVAQYNSQPVRLYNTDAWFDADAAIGLTEGEPDAICVSENMTYSLNGQPHRLPALGIPGAEMWKSHAGVWKFAFRNTRFVYFFAHGDEAGRDLARQVADTLGWQLRLVQCPEGEDVSSMVAGGHAGWFRDKLIIEKEEDDDE